MDRDALRREEVERDGLLEVELAAAKVGRRSSPKAESGELLRC